MKIETKYEIGQTVWHIRHMQLLELVIEGIRIFVGTDEYGMPMTGIPKIEYHPWNRLEEDVFGTKEEAKQKLFEMLDAEKKRVVAL